MKDDIKIIIPSFLIAILFITMMIIVIPKIDFTRSTNYNNDEKVLADFGNSYIPPNCKYDGEVNMLPISDELLCKYYDIELQGLCFELVAEKVESVSGTILYKNKYKKYTCTTRNLSEYNVSCKNDDQGYTKEASEFWMRNGLIIFNGTGNATVNLDALMCDSDVLTNQSSPYFINSRTYSCFIDGGSLLYGCGGTISDCHKYILQDCERVEKSGSSGSTSSTLPKKEYSLDCVPVTGNPERKKTTEMESKLCSNPSNQSKKGKHECYVMAADSNCYGAGTITNPLMCDYIKYSCNRTLDPSSAGKPSNGCNEGDVCCEIFGYSLISKIKTNILIPLRIIAPILLLVLTTVDFAKIVFSENNKDGMPKAWKNFLKRAIATLIIFFASNIVSIIYGFIQGGVFCPFG